MREISFRDKKKDNSKWVYGYLYIRNDGQYEISHTDDNGKKIFEGDGRYIKSYK